MVFTPVFSQWRINFFVYNMLPALDTKIDDVLNMISLSRDLFCLLTVTELAVFDRTVIRVKVKVRGDHTTVMSDPIVTGHRS